MSLKLFSTLKLMGSCLIFRIFSLSLIPLLSINLGLRTLGRLSTFLFAGCIFSSRGGTNRLFIFNANGSSPVLRNFTGRFAFADPVRTGTVSLPPCTGDLLSTSFLFSPILSLIMIRYLPKIWCSSRLNPWGERYLCTSLLLVTKAFVNIFGVSSIEYSVKRLFFEEYFNFPSCHDLCFLCIWSVYWQLYSFTKDMLPKIASNRALNEKICTSFSSISVW